MTALFLHLLDRSLAAGWLVLAILALRLLLRKAPRNLICGLWSLVGLRLLCPVSIQSALSLIPRTVPAAAPVLSPPAAVLPAPPAAAPSPVSPALPVVSPAGAGSQTAPDLLQTAVWIWAAGAAVLLLYALFSTLQIRRRVMTAVRVTDQIWQSEQVDTPFLFGIFRPRIYLPFRMDEDLSAFVIAHEQAHLARRDHWWKPLGFILLAIYWFHPLLWAAYFLLCRDIELACDEAVIRKLGTGAKKAYSEALLTCSLPRHMAAACPLAFGEVGVKARVRSILHYRRPAFWVIALSLAACGAVAVCFLTDPKPLSEEILVNGSVYLRQGAEETALPAGSYPLGTLRSIVHGTAASPAESFTGSNLDPKYAGNSIYQSGQEPEVIYLEDLSGTYLPFRTAHAADFAAVTWRPTSEAGFPFRFDVGMDNSYIDIDVSCDHGTLFSPGAEGRSQGDSLRFRANEPLYWLPDSAERAALRFSVYDGAQLLYTGFFAITRTESDGGPLYTASLAGTDLLTLRQLPDNQGAAAECSSTAVITVFSDLDHDGETEYVVVRSREGESYHELAVQEQDGTRIWSETVGSAPEEQDTLLLYSTGQADYLARLSPAGSEGGRRTCTLFSLENGVETAHQLWSAETGPQQEGFSREVGLLLRSSMVLLSTESGILVNRPQEASALPQLYPVRFTPFSSHKPDGTEESWTPGPTAAQFPQTPLELLFASGAGGWGTDLSLSPDGSFTGTYMDSDMGAGVCHLCRFQGRFSEIRQIGDTVFSMKLSELTTQTPAGQTWEDGQTRYIAADPLGLTGGTEFLLYAPGTPADDLSAECRSWWPDAWLWRSGTQETLTGWGLCNVSTGQGFFQIETDSNS